MLERFDPDLTPIEGGYRIKTVGSHHIDALFMLFGTVRIVETPVDFPFVYDRFWDFPDAIMALVAAYEWDGEPGTEPAGWVRAWDGRRKDARSA